MAKTKHYSVYKCGTFQGVIAASCIAKACQKFIASQLRPKEWEYKRENAKLAYIRKRDNCGLLADFTISSWS